MSRKKTTAKSSATPKDKDVRVARGSRKLQTKSTVPSRIPLSSVRQLLSNSLGYLWSNKKIFGGILAIYGLIQFVLVQGAVINNVSEIKEVVGQTSEGIGAGVALFSYMLGSIGQTSSPAASVYQSSLFVVGSLAIIWALREISAGQSIRIRDAYYKGMYPLVPFILVLLVIGLQTVPALVGAWLYSAVTSTGVAGSLVGQMLWLIGFFILALISFYMVCSSIFALYIVTLPNMTPMAALKSARGLVQRRRWEIARKIIAFLLILLVVAAFLTLSLLLILPPLAPVVFYAGTVLLMGLAHAYLYTMYKELLHNE